MLTFRCDLVCLDPISFLLKTLSPCEWAWHTPRMGFQRCKHNYSKTQKLAKTSHTKLCDFKGPCWPKQTVLWGPVLRAAHSRHPDWMALPAHMATRCSTLRNLVFIPILFFPWFLTDPDKCTLTNSKIFQLQRQPQNLRHLTPTN